MGLTGIQKELIKSVAKGDICDAKRKALACIVEDTTQKNAIFCSKYKQVLESMPNMLTLPSNLQGIVCLEDVSGTFNEGRYYLSERESKVFDNIMLMKRVNAELLNLNIHYVNSTLLYGPSGTGKTTFGKYIACKTGLPFCYLNFSNLIDSYMGKTSKNISKAFDFVMANPCVFMLDEIDCISIKRAETGSSGPDGEIARITITLMQEFDKLPNDVIVIGATNRIDRIDEALLRRFSIKHEVQTLNKEEKRCMVEQYLKTIDMDSTYIKQVVMNSDVLDKEVSQAYISNYIIQCIAEKIAADINSTE